MRKIGEILLLCSALVALTRCGGGNGSNPAAPPPAPGGDATIFFNGGSDAVQYVNDATGQLLLAAVPGENRHLPAFLGPGIVSMASTPNGLFLGIDQGKDPGDNVVIIYPFPYPPPTECRTQTLAGMNPIGMVVSPNGKFLYTANIDSANVSAFTIGADSCITPAGTFSTDADPHAVAVDRTSAYLYVATTGGGIDTFAIDPTTGSLTRMFSSGFDSGTGTIFAVAASPARDFLFATDGGTTNAVHALQINLSTGALTPVGGSPFPTGGTDATGIALRPGGDFVFVANNASNNISVFSVGNDGTLTAAPGSPFGGSLGPVSLESDPMGKYLYVANTVFAFSGNVAAYSIAASGALTPISTTIGNIRRGPNELTVIPGLLFPPDCSSSPCP